MVSYVQQAVMLSAFVDKWLKYISFSPSVIPPLFHAPSFIQDVQIFNVYYHKFSQNWSFRWSFVVHITCVGLHSSGSECSLLSLWYLYQSAAAPPHQSWKHTVIKSQRRERRVITALDFWFTCPAAMSFATWVLMGGVWAGWCRVVPRGAPTPPGKDDQTTDCSQPDGCHSPLQQIQVNEADLWNLLEWCNLLKTVSQSAIWMSSDTQSEETWDPSRPEICNDAATRSSLTVYPQSDFQTRNLCLIEFFYPSISKIF